MILQRVLALACAVSLIGLACRDEQHDEPRDAFGNPTECVERPVRMAVASSLRELSISLRAHLLLQRPSIDVELIFGASSAHARQLAQGAPIDVLVSADAAIVDDLVAREILVDDSRLEFAHGQLSLVAARDWPNRDAGISALESEALETLAVPSVAVPLGRYARAWLSSRGLLERLAGKIVATEHARATLAAIDSGLVDLAIIYRSDLRLAKRSFELAAIDPSEYPPIRYVVARATSAPECPGIDATIAAWGQRFLQRELARAGFLVPESIGARL